MTRRHQLNTVPCCMLAVVSVTVDGLRADRATLPSDLVRRAASNRLNHFWIMKAISPTDQRTLVSGHSLVILRSEEHFRSRARYELQI